MNETKFRQTEIGMIPSDWELKKLSQLCDKFLDGDWIEADDQSSDGFRLIQTGNIGNGRYLDKTNRKHFISEATFKRLNCTEIFEGDVLVSRLPDPVGRACILPESHERRITAVDFTIIHFFNYNPVLFVNYTQTSVYQKAVNECLSGSTRLRISRRNLGNMLIPVPSSKEEQDSIAKVLNNIDAVISTTEKLIAKKKKLKQGAMQTLLSGKMRIQNGKWIKTTNFKQTELGPIPQEWKVEKLSQICDKFLDGDWIEADDQSSEGIRLIQTGNIGNGQYLDKANRKHFISEATFKRLNCTEIFEGDVLVSRLPDPVGRACILPKSHERRITAVDCTIIRFSNYNPILFVNYTQTSVYQNAVNECLSGSTRLRISRKNLGEMLIPVPPTKEEQTAIATVLSDMDAEIAALETKLAKYRQLKTGMMQQLLTGKNRLV